MTEPSDPREPTPQMRRLAESIRRSGDTLRTLPGMLSRSLAPRGGRHRLWYDLRLLGLALLPFVIAAVVMLSRGGHGAWVIVQAAPPPWRMEAQVDARIRAMIGEAVVFERTRVRGPELFACRQARYAEIGVEPAGLFQGALADDPEAAARAGTLGFEAMPVPTLRVDCDNASFDFHRNGDRLLTMIDGIIVRLVPR